jgi:alcohol dehydrogenase class IV
MAYAVAAAPSFGDFAMPGYDHAAGPILPHGVSVMLAAPAAFRFTASACPERHLRAAEALGVDIAGVDLADAGKLLADQLIQLLQKTGLPSGLRAVGFADTDLEALCAGAEVQARLLGNAPRTIDRPALFSVFKDAMTYSLAKS